MTAPHDPQRLAGWPHAASPYHAAELELQERAGVRAKMDVGGRHSIRDYMPDQHRLFFEEQRFLILGVRDAEGQPWASLVYGSPGFIRSPNPRRLEVQALPAPGDPAREALRPGVRTGLLGIQPATRRRNRMNGEVISASSEGFGVSVVQSYGNCPQYIQARDLAIETRAPSETKPDETTPDETWGGQLSEADIALLQQADTFFIASAAETGDSLTAGADVSHRGGKPGFIRVDSPQRITTPDFKGNFFFNTLGNLVADARAGLLLIDFDKGDLLQIAANARIIWPGPEVERYEGAQRIVQFEVRQVRRARGVLPFRWGEAQLAPQLAKTGSW